MKSKMSTYMAIAIAALFGLAFLSGVAWSLVPIAGDTLPHLLEEWTGISFKWSALLVSSVLGFVCVGAIVSGALVHAVVEDTELD